MTETTTTDQTAEETTAPVPQQASEVTLPEAPKPAQDAKARPRVPRAHCAC